jgi:Family of unknown function (DUF6166)
MADTEASATHNKAAIKFIGLRTEAGCDVWVSDSHGIQRLRPRLDLRRHSPAGFEWGYGGSGPAQLALAMLAMWSRNDGFALKHYQDFKFHVIGRLPHDTWELTGEDIKNAIAAIHARRATSHV